jgi:hypothetical protein
MMSRPGVSCMTRGVHMDREELSALHDALGIVLTWPENVRTQIAAWLAPEAAKPNGVDHHPLRSQAVDAESKKFPRPAKTRHASNTRTAERKLLEALQGSPGSSVSALAKAAGASRSRAGERLRGLASRGLVTKDSAGHWRLVADLAGEPPGPTLPPAAAS